VRGDGALQGYLRLSVINRINDEIRRVERRPQRDELDTGVVDTAASPLEAAIGAQAVERYEGALASLTEIERQMIVARIELGHTYEEIARLVGKPTADAARIAVARALAKLAHLMSSS
jgi:RNA polymerase sigma-70 factor (ECF subfamily)